MLVFIFLVLLLETIVNSLQFVQIWWYFSHTLFMPEGSQILYYNFRTLRGYTNALNLLSVKYSICVMFLVSWPVNDPALPQTPHFRRLLSADLIFTKPFWSWCFEASPKHNNFHSHVWLLKCYFPDLKVSEHWYVAKMWFHLTTM